ncbi:MAG: hypothetical protein L3J93_01595, partial [Thermoplasmata archaeon]|nr:hypothetical protein [Thermoplasmata archaeon]
MSAGTRGAGSGVILGLVAVLLGQQFSLLVIVDPIPTFEELFVAMVLGGLLGALVGWRLGKRYRRLHPVGG